jgi:hypothetical protein
MKRSAIHETRGFQIYWFDETFNHAINGRRKRLRNEMQLE